MPIHLIACHSTQYPNLLCDQNAIHVVDIEKHVCVLDTTNTYLAFDTCLCITYLLFGTIKGINVHKNALNPGRTDVQLISPTAFVSTVALGAV